MHDLAKIGRLPTAGDNAAIAVRDLPAGEAWRDATGTQTLRGPLLEGHRFAVQAIPAGSALLSWGLPFGRALRDIAVGEWLCNDGVLRELNLREPRFALPAQANFADIPHAFAFDPSRFRPSPQVPVVASQLRFQGYPRAGGRGTGTRNCIVILGTSSRTAGLARVLEARLKGLAERCEGIDGIVAVAHTEGGEGSRHPNNEAFVLRTLAGFMVHPNVAAVLALDHGTEAVNNAALSRWLCDHDYPLNAVLHRFVTVNDGFDASLAAAEAIVRSWLEPVSGLRRVDAPLSDLRIALQCGGSDAFSGISGNPLAAAVARKIIEEGGSAVLAETDELIGAEPYVLERVADLATAEAFLQRIETFRRRAARHGHSAEGNPSGGNLYRGLYNIMLKSIGAARKKDPDVRLDHVLDYGQRSLAPGFHFMDSPGNDLESIAGQVASGCNLIFFITGNGSITNFPFVPTVKFVTTTRRWELLRQDMDVNAGCYLDGADMATLSEEALGYSLKIASGQASAGERARHAQVSIWREWRLPDDSDIVRISGPAAPAGEPLPVRRMSVPSPQLELYPTEDGHACERIGLVMPTSLCSGQVALRIARHVDAASRPQLSRCVALPHTEGCGASSGENEAHYLRVLAGHLVHPLVAHALLLEHGCEKTHNALVRRTLEQEGIDPARFGYASIQADGGIDRASARVAAWFAGRVAAGPAPRRQPAGLDDLSLGLLAMAPLNDSAARGLARLVAVVVNAGGTVVQAEHCRALASTGFRDVLGLSGACLPTLAYGQAAKLRGFHIMASPSRHAVEILTGLGGTGVQLLLVHGRAQAISPHPMIQTLQFATAGSEARFAADFDLWLGDAGTDGNACYEALLGLVCDTASGRYRPKSLARGDFDFQLTRGLTGVSL